MQARGSGLFFALMLLIAAAATVLVTEGRTQHHRRGRGEAFQRLVGGVGFGPALDLSGCAFRFDPRLDGSCAAACGPIPGGDCFCPRHTQSVFYYPRLRREGAGHAHLP